MFWFIQRTQHVLKQDWNSGLLKWIPNMAIQTAIKMAIGAMIMRLRPAAMKNQHTESSHLLRVKFIIRALDFGLPAEPT
nr:hypothetical protein [uncultured bacterium]